MKMTDDLLWWWGLDEYLTLRGEPFTGQSWHHAMVALLQQVEWAYRDGRQDDYLDALGKLAETARQTRIAFETDMAMPESPLTVDMTNRRIARERLETARRKAAEKA